MKAALKDMILGRPVSGLHFETRIDTAPHAMPESQPNTASFPEPHLTVPQVAAVIGLGVPAIRRAILTKRLRPDVTFIAGRGVNFLLHPSRIPEIRTLLS